MKTPALPSQADALRVRRPQLGVDEIRPAALEISAIMERMAAELERQSDTVKENMDLVEGATQNVRKGNRELQQATSRPSAMRDFALIFIGVLALVVLFLDWYTP